MLTPYNTNLPPDLRRLKEEIEGYARDYGLLHSRSLWLSRDGASLWGEDRLTPARNSTPRAETPIALRFHVHPDVRVAPDDDALGATLLLPGGETWRFQADSRQLAVEESIFFSAPARLQCSCWR